jgi:hypothetical protein
MTVTTAAARAAATIGVLALALTGCGGSDTDGDAATPGASPKPPSVSASPGQDAAEPEQTLPARWWSWAADAPKGRNPIADGSGKYCTQDQPDDVFFLAGSFGETGVERRCTVPAGKPVYFPLLNQVCLVEGRQTDAAALKACQIFGDGKATLDGVLLDAQEQTSGARFDFEPRRGNDLDLSAGDAVAWGIWVGPVDLEPGAHTLEISGESGDFEVGVTYELTVK